MRRYSFTLLATAAAMGLAMQVASAADLPRKAPAYQPPPPPPPLYNWTGFYLGAHLGAGWVRNETSDTSVVVDGVQFLGGGEGTNNTGVGVLGGLQLGYNWQIPGQHIVLGIEGEWTFADLKASSQRSASDSFGDIFFFGTQSAAARSNFKVNDIATITGRFGLASGPRDSTLWYVKGGGAYQQSKLDVAAHANETVCGVFFIAFCDSQNATGAISDKFNRWGWTVGTGVEFGLWDNWSAKIEYDYLNFGSRTVTFNGHTGFAETGIFFDDHVPFSVSTTLKDQIHEVKVGLNYRFNWGKAPY